MTSVLPHPQAGVPAAPATPVRPPRPGGVCRVTVVHGSRSVDLALPERVPLAGLLGELVAVAGVPLAVSEPGPLVLTRPGSGPIHPSRTLLEAGVADGDLLVLTAAPLPVPRVVDDLGRAIAAAVDERPGQWGRGAALATLRAAMVALSSVAALVHAVSWWRGGHPFDVLPLLAALGLVALAATVTWTRGGSTLPPAAALAALPWAALAGPGLSATDPLTDPRMLAVWGGTGLALAAGLGSLATARPLRPALAAGLAGIAAAAGAGALAAGASPEQTGAGLVTAGLLVVLALPRLTVAASGLSGLGDSSLADVVEERVDTARRLLAWLLAAAAAIVLGGVWMLTATSSRAGWALAAGAAVVLALRARTWRFTAEVVPSAVAAVAGLVLVADAVSSSPGTLVAGGLVAVISAVVSGLVIERQGAPRPLPGKLLELLEVAVLVMLVPLALSATGVLGAIRTAAGGLLS
jgi:type VII secretion integral membrane protein EccD